MPGSAPLSALYLDPASAGVPGAALGDDLYRLRWQLGDNHLRARGEDIDLLRNVDPRGDEPVFGRGEVRGRLRTVERPDARAHRPAHGIGGRDGDVILRAGLGAKVAGARSGGTLTFGHLELDPRTPLEQIAARFDTLCAEACH
jgi:hypothetical protein